MISWAMLSLIEINKQQEEKRRERERERERMRNANLSGSLNGLCRPCFGHLDKLSING
jgi:hypothetical protein